MRNWALAILFAVATLTGLASLTTDAVATCPQLLDSPLDEQPLLAPIDPVFATIDITVDPKGKPLGAYQFELTSEEHAFTVVGVEAGDHPAFDHGRPPYFDRTATEQNTDRLIVAEYALPKLEAEKLPTQATRVVTVHVMLEGIDDPDQMPELKLELTAAGDADGEPIDANASYRFRNPERSE